MKSRGLANSAVAAIIRDIRYRRGLGEHWDAMDNATKNEIRLAWERIVHEHIAPLADIAAKGLLA